MEWRVLVYLVEPDRASLELFANSLDRDEVFPPNGRPKAIRRIVFVQNTCQKLY